MVKNQLNTVLGGLRLVRVYDDSHGPMDSQCGSLEQWNTWLTELTKGLEYYWFGSAHKMLDKAQIFCYGSWVPFKYHAALPGVEAYVENVGNYGSNMHIKYFNAVPGSDPYKWDGALSHEMGHVHHNWVRCFSGPFATEFSKFWQKQISVNGTLFNKDLAPWRKVNGGVEYPNEQYANAYRCFFGLPSTRGISGPGTKDPVLEGFKDPKLNQAWCTQMKLLPETAAMVEAYGIKPDTLSWQWGDLGGFQFQSADGNWYAHYFNNSNLAQWFVWRNGAWQRSYPTYNRI